MEHLNELQFWEEFPLPSSPRHILFIHGNRFELNGHQGRNAAKKKKGENGEQQDKMEICFFPIHGPHFHFPPVPIFQDSIFSGPLFILFFY